MIRTSIKADPIAVQDADKNVHVTGTFVTGTAEKLALDVHMLGGLDHVHLKVHQGKLFSVSTIFPSVAKDAVADILIEAPSVGSPHCTFLAAGGGDLRVELFEDAIVTSNGVLLSNINNNRNSINVSLSKFYSSPVVLNTGVTLSSLFIPGGSGAQTPGGSALLTKANAEWILATSKKYLLRLTNLSDSICPISAGIGFYEY